LLKNEEIYNCFDTEKLLRRPVGVAITDKTGAAGIKHWIEERYDIQIAKHDPHVIAIKEKIDTEYAADRIAAISDDEMIAWSEEVFGDKLPQLR
jgi:isopropylmalate/homocitrate/citramalate synthase